MNGLHPALLAVTLMARRGTANPFVAQSPLTGAMTMKWETQSADVAMLKHNPRNDRRTKPLKKRKK